MPYETTARLVRDTGVYDAEAVFVSCTNLPTYDVITMLEADRGKAGADREPGHHVGSHQTRRTRRGGRRTTAHG